MKKTPGPKVADPDNPPLTQKQLVHVRKGIPNSRAIRHRLKMTQEEFARAFGFSLSSVRDWEQGRHEPDTNTLSYLRTIALEPERVLKIRRDARLAPA
jgi:putative transcriptional regulator